MAAVSGGSSGGSSRGIRAGVAYVELFLEDNAFRRQLAKMQDRMQKAGSLLSKAGVMSIGAGAVIAGPIVGALNGAMDSITEIGDLANKLDTPIEKLSALAYAAKVSGVSVEELSGHFENLQERIAQAANGTGSADTLATLGKLGLDPKALAQMDRVEQFIKITEALGKVENRTLALGMASSLGGDQFQNVLKIKGIKEAMIEAGQVGAVYTKEQQAQAKELERSWVQASSAVKGVMIEVAGAIMGESGSVKEFTAALVRNLRTVSGWVRENRQVILIALAVAAGLGGLGVVLVTAGMAAKLLATGIGLVSGAFTVAKFAVGLLLSPLGLATAAIVLLLTQTQSGREALTQFGEGMKTAFDTFVEGWGGIVNAVKAGNLELAFKIAAEGVKAIWYGMIVDLGKAFSQFVAENRAKLIALASIMGASKGMSIGRMLGPKGAAVGLLIGSIAAGVGADAALDEIIDISSNPVIEAKRQAALAEMRRLNVQAAGEAAKIKPLPGAESDSGKSDSGKPKPKKMWEAATKAAGAFQSRDFSRLFSAGSIADKQLAAAKAANAKLDENNKLQQQIILELRKGLMARFF